MDMESRLKMIMAEGLRGIRGPFYNAGDYPSLLMLLITIAQALINTEQAAQRHTRTRGAAGMFTDMCCFN